MPHAVAVLDKRKQLIGVVPQQRLVGFLADGDEAVRAEVPCDGSGKAAATTGKAVSTDA